jgi:hypothetical protein
MFSKFSLLKGALTVALLGTSLAASAQPADPGYCAARPPPEGLVERCRSKVIVVPETPTAFRFLLTEWMRTCVSTDRAPGLVEEARESVDHVWDLMADRPRQAIRVQPVYTPLKFRKGGRTCYGVESVAFRVTPEVVVEDGDPTVDGVSLRDAYTCEDLKGAARAAKQALTGVTGPELASFRGVLSGIENHCNKFDDTYFPVGPIPPDGAACFNESSAGRYTCVESDKAVGYCTRHLSEDLLRAHKVDSLSPGAFRAMLEERASAIYRGFQYLRQVQGVEGVREMACESVRDVILPKVVEMGRRGKTTLYGYY